MPSPFHCFNSLWTTEPGWFGSVLGSRLLEQGFFPPEKRNYTSLWSYFYFPSLKWILCLWKVPGWQARKMEDCTCQWERSERRNNLAHKGQFCPPLSRGLRRKQAKNQTVSCLCSSLSWRLSQFPCYTLSFPSCWMGRIVSAPFLPQRDTWVFSGLKCFTYQSNKHDSNSVKDNSVSFWVIRNVHKWNHSSPCAYQFPTMLPRPCPPLCGVDRVVEMGSCPQSKMVYEFSWFL